MDIQPINGKPAILISSHDERILVFGDTHIGIEYAIARSGFYIPYDSSTVVDEIVSLCKECRTTRVVHLGDVKHNIPRFFEAEKKAVRKLFMELEEMSIPLDILPGNHDGLLGKMLGDSLKNHLCVRIHKAGGIIIKEAGFFHGHAWPTEDVLKSRCLITSHIHPAITLYDTLGSMSIERCWLRCRLDDGRETIVVPAFNGLCGSQLNMGWANTRCRRAALVERLGLIRRNATDVYTLDGLYLGKLGDITGLPPRQNSYHYSTHTNNG